MTTLTAAATDTLKSYNPATGELVGEIPLTTVGQIVQIVDRARAVTLPSPLTSPGFVEASLIGVACRSRNEARALSFAA